jgi:hypothetical protein
METITHPTRGESIIEPFEDEVLEYNDPDSSELEATKEHVSPESVVSETTALEKRHQAEKDALTEKKKLAIAHILEGRIQRREQIVQLEAEEDRHLETLGYEKPVERDLAKVISNAHAKATSSAIRSAHPIDQPKRRGRPPGSKNVAPRVTAPPEPKQKGKGKRTAAQKAAQAEKMKTYWAKRKKAEKKAN